MQLTWPPSSRRGAAGQVRPTGGASSARLAAPAMAIKGELRLGRLGRSGQGKRTHQRTRPLISTDLSDDITPATTTTTQLTQPTHSRFVPLGLPTLIWANFSLRLAQMSFLGLFSLRPDDSLGRKAKWQICPNCCAICFCAGFLARRHCQLVRSLARPFACFCQRCLRAVQ